MSAEKDKKYLRMTLNERIQHFLLLSSFITLVITGFALKYPDSWLAWLFVHLIFLIGFRNRLAVLLQWAYSYFAYKRGARIITGLP